MKVEKTTRQVGEINCFRAVDTAKIVDRDENWTHCDPQSWTDDWVEIDGIAAVAADGSYSGWIAPIGRAGCLHHVVRHVQQNMREVWETIKWLNWDSMSNKLL